MMDLSGVFRARAEAGESDSSVAPQAVSPNGSPSELDLPTAVAILPSRDAVLYPGMLLPLQVAEDRWVRALSDAASAHELIGLFLQKDPGAEKPAVEDLHTIGTAANVLRLLRLPDGSMQVLLQGAARISLGQVVQREPYPRAEVVALPAPEPPAVEPGDEEAVQREALVKNLQSQFQRMVQLSPTLPGEMAIAAMNIEEPGRLADFVAANTDLESAQRQEILEELDALARVRRVSELVAREMEVLEIGSKIQSQIKESMDKAQREYYLRQQLQAIRKELGETDQSEAAVADLRERLEKASLPSEARKEADRELERIQSIPTASPEYSMVRTYLEWLADLPWCVATEDHLDLNQAQRVLDEDHYDLERVKNRIIEYLAVMKLRTEKAARADQPEPPAHTPEGDETRQVATLRGPVLCLVGPPGVGKTSLGHSIARALGRQFVHMSLGGVRDEAEIRGFRRTYVGAMPGRIVQGIRRAGSRNPVFILDEVDKLGADWRGDPSSALLEVLDPSQNFDFRDHYLDLPFDLSSVLFIATANVLDTVPPALRDRLEVIDLPGYTEDDKLHIARRYLVPRQLDENGLSPEQLRITDAALRRIIRDYTREAGVRNLEREIATVARKSARQVVMSGNDGAVTVTPRQIVELLGPQRFQQEVAEREDEVGVVTGLAYTPVGGEVLFIEASLVPGHGNLILTGQLGDVMKESVQAALTYARSRASALGIEGDPLAERDLHVHVPAGAVPKDGPSAGIAMATAIVSALTRRPIDHTVAMTGEITLRGRVLPIGGLKEKVLAAHRAGIRKVIVPRDNRKDLEEIPARVKRSLSFVFVEHVDQVLSTALRRRVKPERPVVPLRRRSRRPGEKAVAAPRTPSP